MSDHEIITIRVIASRKHLNTIARVISERIRDLVPSSKHEEAELRELLECRSALMRGLAEEGRAKL